MMKDTPEGQTNHCPLCEEAGRKLAAAQAEIERLSLELRRAQDCLAIHWRADAPQNK